MFIQVYGVRPITDDTKVIEAEPANSSLTLAVQSMKNYAPTTTFLLYYQGVNNSS